MSKREIEEQLRRMEEAKQAMELQLAELSAMIEQSRRIIEREEVHPEG